MRNAKAKKRAKTRRKLQMQSPIKPRRSRRLEEKAAAAAFAKPNSSPNPAPTTPTSTKPKRSKRLNGKRVAVVFQLDTVYGGVKSNLPTRYLIAAVNAMQTMSSPENASSFVEEIRKFYRECEAYEKNSGPEVTDVQKKGQKNKYI